MNKAELCAACHTLFTPTVNPAGEVVGEFPEQTPYLEWKNSAYRYGGPEEKTCQECHMPKARGGVVISNRPRRLAPRSPFFKHFFVGGNTFMLEALAEHRVELKVTAGPEHLNLTRQRTLEQLTKKAAAVSIVKAEASGGGLVILVRVTNRAGHKFPTGFPSRRAWIHLTVTDRKGETFFESGGYDGRGAIVGLGADAGVGGFERHHREVAAPGRVQIYEGVMKDTEGRITFTLLEAAAYAKDNRLPPKGYDPARAEKAAAVIGAAAADQDFIGGSDKIVYRVRSSGHQPPFTVRAQFLYQTASPGFLADLAADRTGDPLLDFLIRANKPVIISSDEIKTN